MTTAQFPNLSGQQYMSLTTFRKNGTPVPTPVWFVEQGGRLYVTTQAAAGKVKRIRNNSRVTVAPCKVNGEVTGAAVEASAQVITDDVKAALALRSLRGKYGVQFTLFTGMGKIRQLFGRKQSDSVYLEIMPV